MIWSLIDTLVPGYLRPAGLMLSIQFLLCYGYMGDGVYTIKTACRHQLRVNHHRDLPPSHQAGDHRNGVK